ncbi:MAG: phosphoadenylyl-sulfate reductase [Thermodesulfobacteriota bacterium]
MTISTTDLKAEDSINTLKKRFNSQQVEELNKKFEHSSAEEILEWATYLHPRVALASSFQSQGVVLIDMFMKINQKARIFTIDTGRLNEETYQVMDAIGSKYGAKIEILFPDKAEVEEMVKEHGPNLFYKGRDNRLLCCDIRKVRPLNSYLPTLDSWITSIRKDQTENRAQASKFEIDEMHGGILKINPLVDWSSKQVWEYINDNNVPYNKLHDIGYPSIGCAPCTRPVKDGEDPRSGRWWWENDSDKECGLHMNHKVNT